MPINIGELFTKNASRLGKAAKEGAGFMSGVFGYTTGIASQAEEAVRAASGKPMGNFMDALGSTSAASAGKMMAASALTKLVKEVPKEKSILGTGYGLSAFGRSAVIGAGVIGMAKQFADNDTTRSLGQISPSVSAPPSMTYDYNGVAGDTGAGGDLVFALNKLRKG